jgi:two-component system LytT family response regulator
MIQAIIIDDEAKGRMALREKLTTFCPEVNVMAEAAGGQEAIALIMQLKPHLLFLDIEMPRMTGFEMLNNISEKTFQIIFTTAYDQYAIRAIKYAAFDYLLKPVDIDELKMAIARIATKETFQTGRQVELLTNNMQQSRTALQKLAIPTLEGLHFYDIKDIIYLEANSNYTNICLVGNSKIIASRTLKEFSDLLPEEQFFRTHHSFVINLNYIKRYIKGDGGQIEMQNGSFVDVSRRKKEEFLKRIGY